MTVLLRPVKCARALETPGFCVGNHLGPTNQYERCPASSLSLKFKIRQFKSFQQFFVPHISCIIMRFSYYKENKAVPAFLSVVKY